MINGLFLNVNTNCIEFKKEILEIRPPYLKDLKMVVLTFLEIKNNHLFLIHKIFFLF